MITFGYRNRLNGPLRALAALAIGIVMLASRTNAIELAVRIIAAFLVASGVVSLIYGYIDRRNGTMSLMGFNAGVDIILGILVFLWPGFVAGLIVYVVGFLLLGFGLFQIIALISANKVLSVGLGSFIMPVLVVIAGGFLIANPSFIGSAIGAITGIALILYGISELWSSWKMKKAMDVYDIRMEGKKETSSEREDIPVKDVEYEKVDEQ